MWKPFEQHYALTRDTVSEKMLAEKQDRKLRKKYCYKTKSLIWPRGREAISDFTRTIQEKNPRDLLL